MGFFDRLTKLAGLTQDHESGRDTTAATRRDPEKDLAREHFDQGNRLLDQGDATSALASYSRVVQYKPDSAAVHCNIGSAYLLLGNAEAAISACRQAIALKPDFVDAHMTQGLALGKLGLHEDAARCYSRAIELRPDFLEAHWQLGITLHDLGRFEEAILSYQIAIQINPAISAVHSNLGAALNGVDRTVEAIACYDRSLAINPNAVDVLLNLGIALQGLGQLDRAIQCYTRILDIDSDHHEAHINLGVCLRDVGKCAAAIERFLRAASIQPNNAAGPINLGITLATMGKLEQAVTSYQHALTIQPENTDAHLGLGNALKDQGHLEEALDAIRRALELDADRALAHNNLLFIHNYLADQPAERLLAEAQRFGDMVARLAKPYTEWPNLPDPNRALRVGFVSGDLSGHPVGYFLEGVLAALASEATGKLELYAYPSILRDDETSKRLRASCKAWHSAVGLSDAALAQRIREDGIDILIDLSGHTANNRLPVFAWKPAPIQVSWLGYFATTGVAAMDYFVADPWTLPPDQEAFFTEKVWRLPETRLCFTPPNANLDVNALPALNNSYITFGCFNNLSKMNDAVVQLWARVLNAVPASRLFLKYQQLAEASVRQSTRERFAVHGIAAERLIFEDYVPRANYLAAYHRVDIALDPFPFPGGTTTVEALWMGIPVLTLSGERFLARQGVGLLMNAGLPDWVASDHDDYVARAVTHASDLQKLAALRAKLRQQVLASPIYDAPRFAKHFEAALRGMWLAWCAIASAKQSN